MKTLNFCLSFLLFLRILVGRPVSGPHTWLRNTIWWSTRRTQPILSLAASRSPGGSSLTWRGVRRFFFFPVVLMESGTFLGLEIGYKRSSLSWREPRYVFWCLLKGTRSQTLSDDSLEFLGPGMCRFLDVRLFPLVCSTYPEFRTGVSEIVSEWTYGPVGRPLNINNFLDLFIRPVRPMSILCLLSSFRGSFLIHHYEIYDYGLNFSRALRVGGDLRALDG